MEFFKFQRLQEPQCVVCGVSHNASMRALRTSSMLIRLVLVWWALTLGAATASPLVAPKMMELVCSDGGAMRLVLVDKNGDAVDTSHHVLECSGCLPAALSAPVTGLQMTKLQLLAYALTSVEEARIASLVGAPLPPRGPPSHT